MTHNRKTQWWHGLLEILGEGLFESEAIWWFAAVAMCIVIVCCAGYAIYQMFGDQGNILASVDLSTHFDSISINPDKWR